MSQAAAIAVPERLNEASVRAMHAAFEQALAAGAPVVALEGGAGRFCLGMDFGDIPALVAKLDLLAGLLGALFRSPRPTLAVVDGPALGGGLGLAAACDYVLASDSARFGLPEALYGLAPAMIRPLLLTRLPPQKLRLLLLSCHSRSAEEARVLGLVDEVVAAQALPQARSRIVRQLGRANPATVRACRIWEADALEREIRAGQQQTAAALRDPQVLEALRRIAEEEGLPWKS